MKNIHLFKHKNDIDVKDSLFFLFFILIFFSFTTVAYAAAPDPGHNISEFSGNLVQGDLLYGSAADTISILSKNSSVSRYISNVGTGNNPTWSQVYLTNGVTGILPSGNGGTNNAFFSFSSAATGLRIFAFPNADATVLTDHDVITLTQGGTGGPPDDDDQILISNSAYQLIDCTGANKAMTYVQGSDSWGCNEFNVLSHSLLGNSYHTDSVTGTVVRGDLITGQGATPTWTRLAKGTADQILAMDSSGVEETWSTLNQGYQLSVQALTYSPVDGQTVYFGQLPKVPQTTASRSKVYIPKSGVIKSIYINTYASSTNGTAETWSMYFRYNNTADTLINSVASTSAERIFSSTSMHIAVTAGSYFEIKGVQPTWATNPLNVCVGGWVYIE